MLTADASAFVAFARALPVDAGPACARGAFLVTPEGFALAAQSAQDNAYMDLSRRVDPQRALAQHRGLQRALSETLPTVAFVGHADTPDAVFPNNVFATARVGGAGRVILGHMRHAVRRREAERADIVGFFRDVLGYALHDLRAQPGICELTGSLVIDRARGIGLCGLSERCDAAGAAAMHAAFGLRATLMFALAPGEYHTNVVMSALAGRALVIAPDGFADPAVAAALAGLYPHTVTLSREEKTGFAGNCIALSEGQVWMSEAAADALAPATRRAFEAAGFALATVPLDEIEKAGGSLRCCVGEIF
ncbi:MAG: arginine deiminase-related protein [Rehaibacterium terrae]|uniref:arginine deiminase-related protein n=1 Tax=Rehaibacterium terrae TaxID=1341696 RepID=UPI003919B878